MAIDRPEHGSVDNASGLDGGVVWMLVTGKILEGQVLEGARLNLARVVDALRIFASAKSKGKTPRSAGVAGQDYLRPAAVAAGVIPNHYKSRFGWHNLRHSLAMLFASNAVSLPVIQGMLRH